jgi:hypothetical protein
MIQRIQTLYLLLAQLMIFAMLFMPLAHFIKPDGETYQLIWYGIISSGKELVIYAYPLAILMVVIMLLYVVILFLYKNRVVQMRVCIYNMLLLVGLMVLIWYYNHQAGKEFQVERFFKIPALFPVVSAFLTYLAFRAIRKDEWLVRSIDRIR